MSNGPKQLPNGRWVSNGRKAALSCLDSLMGEETNIQKLHAALQHDFELNPVKFFKEMVMPLMPKQMLLPETNEHDAETQAHLLRQAVAEMEAVTVGATVNHPLSADPSLTPLHVPQVPAYIPAPVPAPTATVSIPSTVATEYGPPGGRM